jgi:hypothetical protein
MGTSKNYAGKSALAGVRPDAVNGQKFIMALWECKVLKLSIS